MRITNIQKVVLEVLEESEEARNNDFVLYCKVLRKFGFDTDIEVLNKQYTGNILESITRARRKCVESNPSLAATKRTTRNRKLKEKEIKKWNRNSL